MSNIAASPLESVNRALWFRLPRRAGAFSPSMSVLLRDGDWMTAVPVLGVVVPPASLAAGMLVAASQSSPLWAFDYWPAPVMIGIGALGAAPGIWSALGYLAGLAFLWHDDRGRGLAHTPNAADVSYTYLRASGTGILDAAAHTIAPAIVAALVLVQLSVIVPAFAAACRGLIPRRLLQRERLGTVAAALLSTAIIGLLAVQWQLAAQYAIRPFWTFAGTTPDTPPMDVIRALTWSVCAAGVLVSVLRWTATLLLPPAPILALPGRGTVTQIELPWPLTVAGQALVITVLGAGVLVSVGQGVVFFTVVCGGLLLRTVVLPRLGGFARVVNRIPVAIRLVMLVAVAYLISSWRVGAAYSADAQGLTSFAETAAVVVLASAILLVAPQPRPWVPTWTSRPSSRPPGQPRQLPGHST